MGSDYHLSPKDAAMEDRRSLLQKVCSSPLLISSQYSFFSHNMSIATT